MCFDRFPLLIRISSMGQLTDFKGYKELILNNTVMRFSMDTIKKKKNILKLLVSAVLVLCWGIFFVCFWFGACFAFAFVLFTFLCVLCLALQLLLSSASAFVILYPELQLAICACLSHCIGEERQK